MVRRLWRLLVSQPAAWVALVAWPALVLLAVLARDTLFGAEDGLESPEVALILSALVLLAVAVTLAVRFHRALRSMRDSLFRGEYEDAHLTAREHPALSEGLGLECAIQRIIDFDRRRGERVSAVTRILERLLRESPDPLLLACLEREEVDLSRTLAERFGVGETTFSLDSLLLAPTNDAFAQLWHAVVHGGKSSAESVLNMHLPVRRAALRLRLQLVAVQDDAGNIAHVLGFAQDIADSAPPEPEDQRAPGAEDDEQPEPAPEP
ncbi:hypothetical protein HQ560_09550 [bacterium]|nr:hypothetical protein [bacterium]